MANRQNRSSPDGSSVRRAVALGSGGADPGPSLAPAAPPSGSASPGSAPSGRAARGESEETAGSRPDTSSGAAVGTPAPSSTGAGSATTSRTTSEAGAATGAAAPDTAASASASTSASAGVAAAAAAGGGRASGDGAARGDDVPPSGNPKKPLLAAAGIAGAVLLVVPLLIWATDDSGQKKDKTSVAADSDTVLDGESLGAPQGEYAPAEPSADPSGKPSKSAEAKAKGKAKPNGEAQSPVGQDMPDYSAAVPPGDPKKPAKEKSSSGADTDSGSTQRQAAGPPAGTAAYSVLQLADRNPGRHVCYRAYVQDIGWQSVRCDGATAGTEGQGRPIKALNIAVSGMSNANGTAATPFIQGTGWAGTNWKGAANGVNLTIGTASNSAPNMAGFGISVDAAKSQICQNAHVKDGGWLGVQCDTPASKNNYIFGGTLDKSRWLEAVRFTV